MRPFLLALFLLLAALSPARAATFSDSSRAFSIDLPPEWPQLSLGETAAALENMSPDPNLQCFAGFQYRDKAVLAISAADYPGAAEYSNVTLLQIQQLAASLTGFNPAEFHTSASLAVPNIGIGTVRQVTCVTNPPAFIIDYHDLKRETRSRSFVFIGRTHLVTLHFFLHPDDFPALKRNLDPIAQSFRYRSAQSVAFNDATKAPDDQTAVGTYLLVAIVIAGAAALAYYLFHRRPFEF